MFNFKKTKTFKNNKVFVLVFLVIFVLGFGIVNNVRAAGTDLASLQSNLTDANTIILQLETNLKAAQLKETTAISVKQSDTIQALLNVAKANKAEIEKNIASQNQGFWTQLMADTKKWAQDISWSKIFQTTLSSSLNKIAYDTATWLGSGSSGQKPMFITEGWGAYLTNVGDNAAGTLIEQFGKDGVTGKQFINLCSPDLAVKIKIGTGLVNTYSEKKPACTFSALKTNWEKSLTDPKFLQNFQNMFDPSSNDLGVALAVQTKIIETSNKDVLNSTLTRNQNGGWLSVETLISGKQTSPPGQAQRQAEQVAALQAGAYGKYTGSALSDAANIFLNQLAITGFNTLMKSIGQSSDTYTHPFNWDNLTNAQAGPDASGGITATAQKLNKIIKPNFTTRGDYNILSELTQCPNPTKAGPTNCVIEDKFSQAIAEKKTVAQAIKDGNLDGSWVFGFLSSNNLEPAYNQGYPYRSMLILRKYRILPSSWEVAAQYLKDHPALAPRTLNDLVACYDPSDEYQGYNDSGAESWCQGLVDPNWVLMAPQNYCRKEGPGPEITQTSGSSVTRNDKYCADEQSCVKENSDGTCKLYGYCTEEKRQWDFGASSCEPVDNTCQTFKKDDGSTASYLKNTLDYQGCSLDNAGCAAYCTDYNYAGNKYACTATSTNDKIFLDNNAGACDSTSEGCHGVIRTADSVGANLLINSNFETDLTKASWNATAWSDWGVVLADSYAGTNALQLNTGLLTKEIYVSPEIAHSINGEAFTLSVYAKNCASGSTFGMEGQTTQADLTVGADWQRLQTTNIFETDDNKIKLTFNVAAGSNCTIDAIQLERNNSASVYTEYGQTGLVYEKLAPDYLNCTGATTDPAECKDFARKCTEPEVGCDLYTSQTSNDQIPAKVKTTDQCVAQCVGFNTYLQSETAFESLRPQYFIPKTAKTCNSQAVGCDQFTNLDKLGNGAEAIENYTYLRQCVKATDLSCAGYYTWEGSSESGYQLKVIKLKASGANPAITGDTVKEQTECNETVYKSTDPSVRNADCREFYDAAGNKTYHLYSRTVSCSDDCHPYRKSENNIVKNGDGSDIADAATCQAKAGTDGYNYADNQCVICKNGGTWSGEGCVYNAVPSEGTTCAAAAVGCREYTGSTGQNVQIVASNDFEDGATGGWVVGAGTTASSNIKSTTNGGHSLLVAGQSISLDVSKVVKVEKAYSLTFIAVSDAGVSLTASIGNSAATANFSGTVSVGQNWQRYEFTLANLDHAIGLDEKMQFNFNGSFYIDNIKLTEITSRYYRIKDSWQTPDACNQDLYGNPRALYMLGCDIYKDRGNQTHYLKSFTSLCGDGSVGCELMIDTHNSASPDQQVFNAGDPSSTTVPADNYFYAVYDNTKLCDQADKGCQRLGKPYTYETTNLYQDSYLKNNPDQYASSMCLNEALNCGIYSSSNSTAYFKNPGDMTCEWRQGLAGSAGWYKKKVNRCGDDTGSVCLTAKDCIGGKLCVPEVTDKPCAIDVHKTLGSGGSAINQPTVDAKNQNWAGTCANSDSGCSELVDPVSSFSNNLILFSDFQDTNPATPGVSAGWTAVGPAANHVRAQKITLERNTTYRLAGFQRAGVSPFPAPPGTPTTLSLVGCNNNSVYQLDPVTNKLKASPMPAGFSFDLGSDSKSTLFYSGGSTECTVQITWPVWQISKVELKKAIINYQLEQNLDKTSCNGLVNADGGCVLFNQRSQSGSNVASTTYDADVKSVTPATATSTADADSNQLIKVTPDRACDKWLACKTLVGTKSDQGADENTCLDIGLCANADDSGKCTNFVQKAQTNQTFDYVNHSPANIVNTSGYSKVGNAPVQSTPNDLFPLSAMTQKGELADVMNGTFELHGDNGYPVGWSDSSKKAWSAASFSVVAGPAQIQKEGLVAAPEGVSVLKVSAGTRVDSQSVFVSKTATTDYVLTASLNSINLDGGAANRVNVNVMNDPTCPGGSVSIANIYLEAGRDWQEFSVPFKNSGCGKFFIRLSTDSNNGNYYADNIRIRPALENRFGGASNSVVPQSCRLYPNTNSPSCEYTDDSGYLNSGWYGYCLEYDHAPGNPNTCLLWWPAEKVRGDSFNELNGFSGGYNDKYPAYYCDNLDANFRYVEKRQAAIFKTETVSRSCFWGSFFNGTIGFLTGGWSTVFAGTDILGFSGESVYTGGCPQGAGYLVQSHSQRDGCGFWDSSADTHYTYYCLPSSKKFTIDDTAGNVIPSEMDEWGAGGWYEYNGNLIRWKDAAGNWKDSEITNNVKILDLNTNTLVSPSDYNYLGCKSFYQTVGIGGENKAWTGRMNADYVVPQLNYTYNTDDKPFGSAVPPVPDYNPYEWDGNSKFGRQPVAYYLPESQQVRSGSPYKCTGGKCYRVGHCKDSGDTCISPVCNNDACSGAGTDVGASGAPAPSECYKAIATATSSITALTWQCVNASSTPCVPATNPDPKCNNCTQVASGGPGNVQTLVLAGSASNDCQWRPVSNASSSNPDVQKWTQSTYGCSGDEACVIDNVATQNAAAVADPKLLLEHLYAKSYGHFIWDNTQQRYIDDSNPANSWDLSQSAVACPGGVRPVTNPANLTGDLCWIAPSVSNVKADNAAIKTSGLVKLSFNSTVDVNQMPLVYYKVSWGDGTETVVSGDMYNKQNPNEPHYLYHFYDYWDLINRGICATNPCDIAPRVMIRDNWGIESASATVAPANHILISEK